MSRLTQLPPLVCALANNIESSHECFAVGDNADLFRSLAQTVYLVRVPDTEKVHSVELEERDESALRRISYQSQDTFGVSDQGYTVETVTHKLISATIPCLLIASCNAKVLWDAHWAHWDHMAPLEERTEYPYQNMRTKNFFWGDGDKTLL